MGYLALALKPFNKSGLAFIMVDILLFGGRKKITLDKDRWLYVCIYITAKENVKSWVRDRLYKCCENQDTFHDEILYLKKILTILD